MAYTKGPWIKQVTVSHGEPFVSIRQAGDFGYFVALMNKGTDNDEGNADLLTAAPDLLEALESILFEYVTLAASGDCGHWNPEEEDEVIKARAAIAKARGEVPNE